MKFYLSLISISVLLSSCLKQSIADAMVSNSNNQKNKITATLSYEINGNPVNITVNDADNQVPGNRILVCEKSNGYNLSGRISSGDFVFTFFTDSLKVGNYNYKGSFGPMYVTTFQGFPQYIYGPTDNMNFFITSYTPGHISGSFTGQLTPAISQGNPNNVYGTLGSVLIKNGRFNNVPVIY